VSKYLSIIIANLIIVSGLSGCINVVEEDEERITDIKAEKLLIITVDVEAGNNCRKLVSNNTTSDQISTCMYGIFGEQRAGIIEMMDVADEAGVKISFFVDVLEIYAYGDKLIQVMQDIDSRGHDVQLHFHPSMINSTSWEVIQNSEDWNESGANNETFMSCWNQETSDYWFSKAMAIFDDANIPRPIAFRGGAYRYCDTLITAMGNHHMTQSYNYNMHSSGRQNFSSGYLDYFRWDNGVMEFPISYVEDLNGEIQIGSRIDESTWTSWNESFERFFSDSSSTQVMTMVLHSFSFLSRDGEGQFYLEDYSKLDAFKNFLNHLSPEYEIVTASELQSYIDTEKLSPELELSRELISNECTSSSVETALQ